MDEQPNETQEIGTSSVQSEEALRELALRLLAQRFHYAEWRTANARLLPGQIPDALPFALPLPEGARVVGTLAQKHITIVLDCPQTPTEVLAFYRERFGAMGWRRLEFPHAARRGFVTTGFGDLLDETFCSGEHGPACTVNIFTPEGPNVPSGGAGGVSDVRLEIDLDAADSPCGVQNLPSPAPRHHDTLWTLLPSLQAPLGARQQGGGGSSGDREFASHAQLETDLDLAAVAAHYNAQLQQGGWEPAESGSSGPIAWSTWRFQDEAQRS